MGPYCYQQCFEHEIFFVRVFDVNLTSGNVEALKAKCNPNLAVILE